ncbi:amidohydrolase family protein [Mesorhizobium japonicum]|uniref:amidohydrolase family protein n=1 Tax=Mesorhizobium japonicum TaxID=2066070 RepID=UPI003B5CF670
MIVDAHVHLWDRATDPQHWIDPQTMAAIDRDFGSPELAQMLDESGVDRAVVVQSVNDIGETGRLLARRDPRIAGIVGWIDVAGDVTAQLAAFNGSPGRLVGVRHLAHVDPDPQWLRRPDVGAGLDTLGAFDLAFDLVVRSSQLGVAARVAAEHPSVRFVLDHLGGVAETDDVEAWERDFRDLAQHGNVTAKVSGLWRIDDELEVRRIVGVAVEAFGPSRLLYGSDWPLARLGVDAPRWRRRVDDAIVGLGDAERSELWSGTATRVYRLA